MSDQATEIQIVISEDMSGYYYSTNYSLDLTTSKLENTTFKLYSKMFDYNFCFSEVFVSQVIDSNTSQLDFLYHLYVVVYGPITIC